MSTSSYFFRIPESMEEAAGRLEEARLKNRDLDLQLTERTIKDETGKVIGATGADGDRWRRRALYVKHLTLREMDNLKRWIKERNIQAEAHNKEIRAIERQVIGEALPPKEVTLEDFERMIEYRIKKRDAAEQEIQRFQALAVERFGEAALIALAPLSQS